MEKLKSNIHAFLRWSEKYTKTDMVYLAKGGFWLVGGSITSSLIGFLLTIIFANLLPKETFGSYKYVLSFVGILSIPALPGMGTAIAQTVAQGNEGSFISSLKTKIKWGFLSTIFSFILSSYYYINQNNILAISFFLIGIFIPFMESFGIYSNYLHGKKLFSMQSKFDVFSQLTAGIITTITIFFTKNLFILLFAYLTAWTLVRFIGLNLTLKKFPPNDKKDPSVITYSKHLSLMRVIGTISSSLDKILLWHFLGPIQVATYVLALSIPTHLNNLTRSINRLAFPKLAQQKPDNLKRTLPSKIFRLFVAIIFVVIFYIIFAPLIFKLFFPKYMEAVLYSQIFSIILLAQPISMISTMLGAHSMKKELYWLNTLSPIFYIILQISLIPVFGITGAVFSFVGSKIFESLILIYFIKK